MAIPPTAATFARTLDPNEQLDWLMPCAPLLEAGEAIDTYTLTLLPEAVAMGLTIMSHELVDGDRSIKLWLTIDDAFQADPAFDGAGTALGMEVTLVTNSTPPRTRQRTALVKVAHQ